MAKADGRPCTDDSLTGPAEFEQSFAYESVRSGAVPVTKHQADIAGKLIRAFGDE